MMSFRPLQIDSMEAMFECQVGRPEGMRSWRMPRRVATSCGGYSILKSCHMDYAMKLTPFHVLDSAGTTLTECCDLLGFRMKTDSFSSLRSYDKIKRARSKRARSKRARSKRLRSKRSKEGKGYVDHHKTRKKIDRKQTSKVASEDKSFDTRLTTQLPPI